VPPLDVDGKLVVYLPRPRSMPSPKSAALPRPEIDRKDLIESAGSPEIGQLHFPNCIRRAHGLPDRSGLRSSSGRGSAATFRRRHGPRLGEVDDELAVHVEAAGTLAG